MKIVIVGVLAFVIVVIAVVTVVLVTPSNKPDNNKPEDKAHVNDVDFPSPKTWWAKRISSDLYTAGRLTERQIKYAADAGFRTIVSLFTFNDNYMIGDDRMLNTTSSRDVAERLAGITFEVVVKSRAEVAKMETVRKFASIMSRAAKPVLLHCSTANRASFMALTYLGYTKQMNSLHIYNYGSRLGYDFASKAPFRYLISNVTGEPPLTNPPKPDVTIPAWNKKYWLMKPVYRNWYVAGQIQSNYVSHLASLGLNVIINCRQPTVSVRILMLYTLQAEFCNELFINRLTCYVRMMLNQSFYVYVLDFCSDVKII